MGLVYEFRRFSTAYALLETGKTEMFLPRARFAPWITFYLIEEGNLEVILEYLPPHFTTFFTYFAVFKYLFS